MHHYLFVDRETGEEFIVGADSVFDATQEARGNFANPRFLCELSEIEAEMSGLDEY